MADMYLLQKTLMQHKAKPQPGSALFIFKDGVSAHETPMHSWDAEDWDSEEFVVELQENSDPASTEPPSSKRLNSGATPERFRCPPAVVATDRQAAAAGGSGGGSAPPAPRQHPQQQQDGQLSVGSRHKPSNGSSSWSVRSIFMARRPESPPRQPLRQLSSPVRTQQPLTDGLLPRSPGLSLYDRGSPDDEEEILGPLTQMAAAHASVASAFCPACGTFLADLGGPREQAAHTAACHARRQHPSGATAGESAAVSGRQQAQHERGAGCTPGEEPAEEGSEEQDGNWSEQEEASQAAAECGLAAAAVAEEDEEAGPSEGGHGGSAAEGAGEAAAGAAVTEEQAALHAWLEARGLGKYAELFTRAGKEPRARLLPPGCHARVLEAFSPL